MLKTLSDSLIEINKMRVVEILTVKDESPTAKSFFFKDEACAHAEAGQFLMVWIPGVDEIPLSLSSISPEDKVSSVTVANVGEATNALNRRRTGDLIGVRGPLGNSFKITGQKALVVGGGIGVAPLMPLIEDLVKKRSSVTVIVGAKTKNELVFLSRLEYLVQDGLKLIVTTDDGSYGSRGFATDSLDKVLSSEKFDMVYTCGPERMIRVVYSSAERCGLPVQASLERIIRCAVGICGSCVIGNYLVCRDGPVFTSAQLREVELELGRFKRGFNGKRIRIQSSRSSVRKK